MSVPVSSQFSRSSAQASRATAAYRIADRLGRPTQYSAEWERLCRADRNRRDAQPFADLFADELTHIEDAQFYDIPNPDDEHHLVRLVYLFAAIVAGTLFLLMGNMLLA